MGIVKIMDATGHSELKFGAGGQVTIGEVQAKIAELTKQGFRLAAKTGEGQHTIVEAFDPAVEEHLLIPQLKGG